MSAGQLDNKGSTNLDSRGLLFEWLAAMAPLQQWAHIVEDGKAPVCSMLMPSYVRLVGEKLDA